MLIEAYAKAAPGARPGLILFVQTFGDLANFNPHVHVLAEGFRRAVLGFLAQNDALSEELRSTLLGWRHSGFSAHNQVRVGKEDPEGRKKLAGTMLRAPMSLEKMTYDALSPSW